jgi:hypothetical protein
MESSAVDDTVLVSSGCLSMILESSEVDWTDSDDSEFCSDDTDSSSDGSEVDLTDSDDTDSSSEGSDSRSDGSDSRSDGSDSRSDDTDSRSDGSDWFSADLLVISGRFCFILDDSESN